MVSTKKHVMLQHFIDEYISVLTNLTMIVINGEHQEEVPLVFEGVLLDFDEDYLMISDTPDGPADLVNRDMVMRISQVVPEVETMPEGATLN